MKTVIIYGSNSGATQEVAEKIAENLPFETKIIDVSSATAEDFNNNENLILGTSTWGDGDLQDDWEDFFDNDEDIDFSNKKVALFGLGDQINYSETFLNGMGVLYSKLKEKGANIIGGNVNTTDFEFDESNAVVDGHFVGLAIDADNQGELSDERVKNWTDSLIDKIN